MYLVSLASTVLQHMPHHEIVRTHWGVKEWIGVEKEKENEVNLTRTLPPLRINHNRCQHLSWVPTLSGVELNPRMNPRNWYFMSGWLCPSCMAWPMVPPSSSLLKPLCVVPFQATRCQENQAEVHWDQYYLTCSYFLLILPVTLDVSWPTFSFIYSLRL